jgi:hypothetical protein
MGLLRASWVVLATLLFGLGAAGGSSGGDFKGGGLTRIIHEAELC